MRCFTLSKVPEELEKKTQLLAHFWAFLEGNEKHKALLKRALDNLNDPEMMGKIKKHEHQNQVFLKKYVFTKHASIFRLSNKLV